MKIEAYTLAYNEEKMLPFFLNHYSKFCQKITIFDNHSTDGSDLIYQKFDKCELTIVKYDSGDKLNDQIYLDIKNNCWRDSSSDYVIIVDCDEFIYHTNIDNYLSENPSSSFKACGYDMCSDVFPVDDIIQEITSGVRSPNYDKICLFSPKQIKNINYNFGCHQAYPESYDNKSPYFDDSLKLLHYKNITFDYRYNKHLDYLHRMSEFNDKFGYGVHYKFDRDTQHQEFLRLLNNSEKII